MSIKAETNCASGLVCDVPAEAPTTMVPAEPPACEPTTTVPSEAPSTTVPADEPTKTVPAEAPTTMVPAEAPACEPTTTVPADVPLPEAKVPEAADSISDDEISDILPVPGILEDLSHQLGSAGVNAHINFASGPVSDVPGAVPLPKAKVPKAADSISDDESTCILPVPSILEELPLPEAPLHLL